MELAEYLTANLSRRRVSGEWDCATLVCDWVVARGFPDPMADYRGRYASEPESVRLVRPVGGMVAAFDGGLRGRAGWRAVAPGSQALGDVGIVSVFGTRAAAIFTGSRWALVADKGLAFCTLRGHVVRVWSPPLG